MYKDYCFHKSLWHNVLRRITLIFLARRKESCYNIGVASSQDVGTPALMTSA